MFGCHTLHLMLRWICTVQLKKHSTASHNLIINTIYEVMVGTVRVHCAFNSTLPILSWTRWIVEYACIVDSILNSRVNFKIGIIMTQQQIDLIKFPQSHYHLIFLFQPVPNKKLTMIVRLCWIYIMRIRPFLNCFPDKKKIMPSLFLTKSNGLRNQIIRFNIHLKKKKKKCDFSSEFRVKKSNSVDDCRIQVYTNTYSAYHVNSCTKHTFIHMLDECYRHQID